MLAPAAAWVIMRFLRPLARLAITVVLLVPSAEAQGTDSPRRVLILGVGATRENSLDPASPNNIREFTHNFDSSIELSFDAAVAPRAPIDAPISFMVDMLSGAANLSGFLTDNVRGALLPLRAVRAEQIVVHSWGAPALMESIIQGIVPAPRQLIVVDPPNILAQSGVRWRAFGEANPGMQVSIHISSWEIFNRVRVASWVARHPGQFLTAYVWRDFEAISRDVLGSFAGTNVTVSTFSVPADAQGAIAAHRLRHFFEFAAANGLHDLTKANVPAAPRSSTLDALGSAGTESSWLVHLSASTARVEAVQQQVEQRSMEIRLPDVSAMEASWKDAQNQAWRYFVSLTELACQSPDQFEGIEGSAHGVVFPQGTLENLYRANKPALSPCASQLMSAILAFDQPVTLAWIRTEAERYQVREQRVAREREAARRRAQREYERAIAAIASSARRAAQERSSSDPGGSRFKTESSVRFTEGRGMSDLKGVLGSGGRRYDSP